MKGNKAFVNEFDLRESTLNAITNTSPFVTAKLLPIGDIAYHFKRLLTLDEVKRINEQIDATSWIPVGTDGILSNYNESENVGSWRMTCFEPLLAQALWKRIKSGFPDVRLMHDLSPTDWDGSYEWEPIGINPSFRFIRYNKNELLIPHYDAPFIQDSNVRSLSSLIMYLTDNPNSGGTRFLKDEQEKLPLSERNYEDWKQEASEDLVTLKIHPSKGDALIFDHRILHDSERMLDNDMKTIIRSDIMYKRVN
jgi:hypothetical protein